MTLRPLQAIVRKDLQVFLSDRRAVILAFIAPAALVSFVAFAIGGEEPGGPELAPVRDAAIAHVFAGMAVQFLLLSAIESGVGLLTERQKGLWRRIRAAPISRPVLLLARALSGSIIAVATLSVLLLFGTFAIGLRPPGSPVGLVIVGLAVAAMSSSLGLLIAALGKTPQAARSLSVLAVLFMVMIGGAWMPTESLPDWLRVFSPLLPTRWAVDGLDIALSPRGSLAETLPAIVAIGGFTLVFSVVACLAFKWDE
jgi:ABC-2 type transport system permease protein